MPGKRLQVFLSSRMQELATERAAIAEALEEMNVDTFVFEHDAGARSQPIRETFEQAVAASHLYIGVFWTGYGPYTIEEFERATRLGMDRLIYEKRESAQAARDPRLQEFLDRVGNVGSGLTSKWFATVAELRAAVKEDVAHWQVSLVERAHRKRDEQTGQPADSVIRYLLKQATGDIRPLDRLLARGRTLRVLLRPAVERAVRKYLDDTLGPAPLQIITGRTATGDQSLDRWLDREARVRDLVGRAIEDVPDEA